MQPYRTFRPTGFDHAGLGCPEQQDWLVAPCITNRDATLATESNWETLLRILESIDSEGETWERHDFNHWGCGWFAIILLKPGTPVAAECERIEAALSDYPLLDDSDYSEREYQAACDAWRGMCQKERGALMREHGCYNRNAVRRVHPPSELPIETLLSC